MEFIELDKSIRSDNWNMNELHSHSHYEIYYLAKGERIFLLSNELYRICAPTIIVIPPYVMHKTEGGPFIKYNVNVSENYLNSFESEVLKRLALKIIVPTAQQNQEFLNILENFSEAQKEVKYRAAAVKAVFSYYIYKLNEFKKIDNINNAQKSDRIPTVVLKIMDYLNENYDKKITLECLSEKFFVSSAAILYNFKKYTNCSPIEFLLNVRLNNAKKLLTGTKLSVAEISEKCGFSSANYFGVIFKKKEGLSPANYRRYKRT